MPSDRSRSLRGALAGAAAAGLWAAQQPLDKKVFGVAYDDCEFLGSAVTQGRYAYPVGVVSHLVNGAIFGALYSLVAPSLPGPAPARGLAAGMAEHLATWPATRLLPLHPASDRFPQLFGDRAAFAQATWRHALFGVTLGIVERKLKPQADPAPAAQPTAAGSNGHGDVTRVIVTSPA